MDAQRPAPLETMVRFGDALVAGDPQAACALFAGGAVLLSPATDRIRFTGGELRALVAAVTDAYEDLRVAHASATGGSFTMILDARIGRQRFQETLVARVDEAGRIENIRASIRPLGGLLAVISAVGERLARRRGRVAAWSFRLVILPVQGLVALGDVVAARLATSPGGRR
jgi:hypothetical protein